MVEVQDIFRDYARDYIERYNPTQHVRKIIGAIINCRTEALGGHTDVCDECGFTRLCTYQCPRFRSGEHLRAPEFFRGFFCR